MGVAGNFERFPDETNCQGDVLGFEIGPQVRFTFLSTNFGRLFYPVLPSSITIGQLVFTPYSAIPAVALATVFGRQGCRCADDGK
jgi:hypothetical protein